MVREPQSPSDSQSALPLDSILQTLAAGQAVTESIHTQLVAMLLANEWECRAFGITADTVDQVVRERSHLFQTIYPAFSQLCRTRFRWFDCHLIALWRFWLPLAIQISEWHHPLGRPLIQGILGGQGTGKTTLAIILALILDHLGDRVCCLSLDDLYKPYSERLRLQQDDPRLRWRGPPGTHDIELGLTVLQQLRSSTPSQPVQIPRFDKSTQNGAGDRTTPITVTNVDIVLFEGWFVGVRPIDPARFATAPPPITTTADQAFARDCNIRLRDYLPLWEHLDRLIVLHPTDYRLSQQWRQQAEQQMIASGRPGMDNDEITEFVNYFWRSLHPDLFIPPLLHDPNHTDLVIEISPNHTPSLVYQPGTADESNLHS